MRGREPVFVESSAPIYYRSRRESYPVSPRCPKGQRSISETRSVQLNPLEGESGETVASREGKEVIKSRLMEQSDSKK